MNIIETLKKRALFFQSTNEEGMAKLLETSPTFIYAGFDTTGESLHLGHLIPLITLCHFGKHGHIPIVLIGGGTARVGDPSGKTEARPLMDSDILARNVSSITAQIKAITDAVGITPIFVNNNDWLGSLNYIDFIRDIGRHFSVSRMLSFDTYKTRLETGLSFLEFNYQLLQAYDYLNLFTSHGCRIQIGGSDQWANIVAGCDLIRRIHQEETFGYTLPIVTKSDGVKMGKTEKGAVFLSEKLTSVYDFYQYVRNTTDQDVISFLKRYTFLSLEEIALHSHYQGADLNKSKELLAFSLTKLIHGEEKAREAEEAAKAAFYGDGAREHMPSVKVPQEIVQEGILSVYVYTNLCSSKGEARRLVEQGGAKLNDKKITDISYLIQTSDFIQGELTLSAGKKKHVRVLT